MKKIRAVFRENVWLTVAMVLIIVTVGAFAWKWSLAVTKCKTSINVMMEKIGDDSSANQIDNAYENSAEDNIEHTEPYVEYTEEEAILRNTNGEILCKYQYIFENDIGTYNKIFRFIDDNGLIGFANIEGKEIVPAKYIEASRMCDGSACVKESEDDIYYIDEEGVRFTEGKYKNAFPYETQGQFGRVIFADGKYGVIDREENIIAKDFDLINELQYTSRVASGVKNGKAVLFLLQDVEGQDNQKLHVIKEYEDYIEISKPCMDIAIVRTSDNKHGVVNIWTGTVIIEAEFDEIKYEIFPFEEGNNMERYVFRCKNPDGTYTIKQKKG